MLQYLHAVTRINLWHFVWIAVVLSCLLSLLVSVLFHGRVLWYYPTTATSIAVVIASILIYVIKGKFEQERVLTDALQESQAQFRAFLENSSAMIFLKDLEGRYLLVNRRFEDAFHVTQEGIAGKTDEAIFPPAQAAAFRANDAQVLRTGMSIEFEEVALHDDGQHTSIVNKFPLHTPDGRLYAIGGIVTDITERKRLLEGLQLSESRCRAFMDNSPAAVFMKDPQGRYVYVNKRIEHRFQTTASAWIGRTDLELWPKQVAEQLRANDQFVLSNNDPHTTLEILETVPDASGTDSFWLSLKFPVDDHTGTRGIAGISLDVTELKRTEEALRVSQQHLHQALNHREQLLQDLHDHVIQSIYAVGMTLEVAQDLVEQEPAEVVRRLRSSITNLNQVIVQLRQYIKDEELTSITASQLSGMLEDLVGTPPGAHPLAIRLQLDPAIIAHLTDNEATQILYVVREAVSNSLRHAKATTAVVAFSRQDHGLCLDVQDDGVGFDLATVNGQGRGLRNMTARANKLGANLTIKSERGQGTRVRLHIPTY